MDDASARFFNHSSIHTFSAGLLHVLPWQHTQYVSNKLTSPFFDTS